MSLNTNPPTDSALDDLTNTTAAMSLNSKDPAGLSPAIDSGVEMDQLTAKTANVSLDDAAPAEGAPSTKSKSKKKKKKKSKAKKTGGVKIAAINEHFDREYGTDYTKLDMWQLLCVDVGIEPAPSSITQCKKALKSSLVNIYDFLSEERPVKQFQSYSQFVKYTRDGRLYPLDKAKEDSFAKMFLRSIPFYGYRH
ncbi:unnamed protein product [Periconia digitata]|uniref:Uncharacterized protein n=1 Tax=Periconia digitata TaxID=1303443 RepID=A0A9W4XP27_9PLEO|nr:unnamed protein product [Periconia digitata]